MNDIHLPIRLKRLRQSAASRSLLQETYLQPEKLIAPLFIHAGLSQKQAIRSMPEQYQLCLSDLAEEVTTLHHLGIKAVLLFGIPSSKDAQGKSALLANGIIQQAIPIIKQAVPDMLVIADVCFCEYTDHGHCGVLNGEHIDNDKTLALLAEQAVSLAQAGVDWIAPSSMTDGMVAAIRQGLDQAGFIHVSILSYAVKYSSAFYGPFREAAEGAPKFGDRKTYQMNPANSNEAVREALLDVEEGADMLMVKPAQNYLDVIYRIKETLPEIPLCAYQVSGEYSLIMKGAESGLVDLNQAMIESLMAIKRAGADMIITYFAKRFASTFHHPA
ncbi:porphobilinogen synthase [Legionella sp. W05-934-2]|uniref:porphobilinogen synthase n=1 Tax=Legionella sp. W05-934-2 TaxID=1198649 RepID=UPI003463828E